ncbi:hypothetical protein COJ90_07300 [Priestia megaterium]|uniref:hypothetical protein n=1 Tax=Priestia megaterium TaxID=1404 RepID=UPI000BF78E25|nr:hypothetical protein [Priestia megaterium]PFP14440.1 hypothetical protein COJ90_07300 [Priestia megaterium]
MTKFVQNRIFRFVVVPIVIIALIFFIVDQYQKNRITGKDGEYVEWYENHSEQLSGYTDALDQLEDNYADYAGNLQTSEMQVEAFYSQEVDTIPKLKDIYNTDGFAELVEEALDQPYPDNKKLREAHSYYKNGNKQAAKYAVDILNRIEDNDSYSSQGETMKSRNYYLNLDEADDIISDMRDKRNQLNK